MAEKQPKKKAKSGAKHESGVLASLPATRPARISNRARAAGAEATAPAKPGPAAVAKPRAATAAKAKPAAPKPAAKPRKAPAAAAPEALPGMVTTAEPARPRPVRSASRNLTEPAKKAAVQRPAEDRSPGGRELVTTVVQAAGELAQVGLTVGGQILKRAVDKLPKP